MKAAVAFFILLSGMFLQVRGQGLINNNSTITIASGAYMSCQGGLVNNGAVTNNGTLGLTGGLINTGTVDGDGNIHIGGDWINNGTFMHGSGTVVFNGTGQQTIVAPFLTVFNNLIFDASSAGTTIAAGAQVTVEGDVFNPSGKLIIDSDALNNNGSLIYTGQGVPSGNLTYNRSMPGGTFYHYLSSPVSASLLPPNGTFWGWNEVAGDWGDPVTGCISGKGYTVRTAGVALSFTGQVVTEANVIATSPYVTDYTTGTLAEYNSRIARSPFGGGGWNLLGNPFTSAIRIGGTGGFLDANDGVGTMATNRFDPNYVAVYIYDGDSYYYRGKDVSFPDPVTGEDPVNLMFGYDNIQAGQGFFVLAMKDGLTFHLDRTMQTHETATPLLKSAVEETYWPGIQLKAAYGKEVCFATVVYNEEMTAGLDPGYDVGLLSGAPGAEIYTALAGGDNSVNFARQALPVAGAEKLIVPVGVDSEKGGEITFSAYFVPLGDNRFWLEDRLIGIFTDLSVKSYTVPLSAATYGTGRFFLHASANMPTGNEELTANDEAGLRIWGYDRKAIIRGEVAEGTVCEIFDTGGRKLLIKRLSGGELNTVDLPEGIHGVIVIRVSDGMKVTTRRLAVL